MSSRQELLSMGDRCYNVKMETFIERVRKARALGCSLSYLGLDDIRMFRKFTTNRIGTLTK